MRKLIVAEEEPEVFNRLGYLQDLGKLLIRQARNTERAYKIIKGWDKELERRFKLDEVERHDSGSYHLLYRSRTDLDLTGIQVVYDWAAHIPGLKEDPNEAHDLDHSSGREGKVFTGKVAGASVEIRIYTVMPRSKDRASEFAWRVEIYLDL